jgi:hypothetical protein
MFTSSHHNDMKVTDKYFENVVEFRYLGTTVKKIKIAFTRKFRAERIPGMLVATHFSFFLSFQCYLKQRLPIVLYACKT